jgi:hypothetical protein
VSVTPSRVLQRLAKGAVLSPIRDGSEYGVIPRADRRRRPVARVRRDVVKALAADGAIATTADGVSYALTPAGASRVLRETAAPTEAFLAQHLQITERHTVDGDGDLRRARGCAPDQALKRLAALRDANGQPWFSAQELEAAGQLRSDWLSAEIGMVRGSDWMAGPQSRTSRGPGNATESAMIRCCEARARVSDALASLAAPLRRAAELACLEEAGFEAIERALGWPARSGKVALKLALAQLAARVA